MQQKKNHVLALLKGSLQLYKVTVANNFNICFFILASKDTKSIAVTFKNSVSSYF